MHTGKFSLTYKLVVFGAAIFIIGCVVFSLPHAQVNSARSQIVPVENHNMVLGSTSGGNTATLKPLALPDASGIAARDAQRISDLTQIQSDIQLYYKKCGYYPGSAQADPTCRPYLPIYSSAALAKALIGSGLGITSVPTDPSSPNAQYFYEAEPRGASYVLGATLEDPTNPALAQSPHGFMYGMICASSVYCVKP